MVEGGAEGVAAEGDQPPLRIIRQPLREGFDEGFQRRVDEAAAVGRGGIGVHGIERLEPEDAPGIDRVGIADPGFHLRHRQAQGPRVQRRRRARHHRRLDPGRLVETRLPAEPDSGVDDLRLDADQAQQAVQAQQPARGNRRRTLDPERASQHQLRRRAPGLGEVVGGKADAPLRRGKAETLAHGPAEPGIDGHLLRPGAFVESAEDDEVRGLQPRLQRSPDREPRMAAEARAHHRAGKQAVEEGGPMPALHRRRIGQRLA